MPLKTWSCSSRRWRLGVGVGVGVGVGPFAEGGGNARELRQSAERLERVAEAMVRGYAAKAGATADAVRQIMTAETWYTAAEAVEAGFADEVTGALDVAAAINSDMLARAPWTTLAAARPARWPWGSA